MFFLDPLPYIIILSAALTELVYWASWSIMFTHQVLEAKWLRAKPKAAFIR
jgi:hypothetical protein